MATYARIAAAEKRPSRKYSRRRRKWPREHVWTQLQGHGARGQSSTPLRRAGPKLGPACAPVPDPRRYVVQMFNNYSALAYTAFVKSSLGSCTTSCIQEVRDEGHEACGVRVDSSGLRCVVRHSGWLDSTRPGPGFRPRRTPNGTRMLRERRDVRHLSVEHGRPRWWHLGRKMLGSFFWSSSNRVTVIGAYLLDCGPTAWLFAVAACTVPGPDHPRRKRVPIHNRGIYVRYFLVFETKRRASNGTCQGEIDALAGLQLSNDPSRGAVTRG